MNTGDKTINEYLEMFASNAPVPGGGGVSSVVGSLAAAAGEMVCSLTIGKKKFALIEENVKEIAGRLKTARDKLVLLADKDAEVFEPLAAAYADKTKTDEEMDALFEKAASVPLEVMRTVYSILDDIGYLADNGSRLALSDAGCAAAYAGAAIRGSILNVFINTKCIKDVNRKNILEDEAEQIYLKGLEKCDGIIKGQIDFR